MLLVVGVLAVVPGIDLNFRIARYSGAMEE